MAVLLRDNSSRSQHHHEFKKGTSQLHNVAGTVVISRPGKMVVTGVVGVKKSKSGNGQIKRNTNKRS
jgi:hypothetical protein